jgi:hypothetical protein
VRHNIEHHIFFLKKKKKNTHRTPLSEGLKRSLNKPALLHPQAPTNLCGKGSSNILLL